MSTTFVDITAEFRKYLLSFQEVTDYVGDNIIDTLKHDENGNITVPCELPFIWYTLRGIQEGDCLEEQVSISIPERAFFDVEIIDHTDNLAATRMMAEKLRVFGKKHKACYPFGQLAVQMVNFGDHDTDYMPYTPSVIEGIQWSALQCEVVPIGLIQAESGDIVLEIEF